MSTAKKTISNNELYVMPFDHRSSFQEKLFGIRGRKPTAAETAEIASYKDIIYEGFLKAIEYGVPKERSAILTDEQFGSNVLIKAKEAGFTTACAAEKSGQEEFNFEYGAEFGAHIEKFDPTFVKILVRYNPEGDVGVNRAQRERIRQLSDYCRTHLRDFMFELLVPATPKQLAKCGHETKRYDRELRPALMARAITELQFAGIEPDVWKVEGMDSVEDCQHIVEVARNIPTRANVGVIILGRGEDDEQVRQWLKTAAKVPGVIGFAVGRTVFWEPLKMLLDKEITRDEAVQRIAQNYKSLCDFWAQARPTPAKETRPKPSGASISI